VLSTALPQLLPKLLIAAVITLASVGLIRFLTTHLGLGIAAASVGGTLLAVNPFMYDRILAGQLLIPLALALIPWALPVFLDIAGDRPPSPILKGVLWVALISFVNLHVGVAALLLLFASVCASSAALTLKAVRIVGASIALFATHLYWLLPFLLSTTPKSPAPGELSVYATRPHSVAVLEHVLLLHGFWRPEFREPLRSYPTVFLLTFIPIVLAACVGLVAAMSSSRFRRPAAALGITSLIAVILAMGTSFPPTAPISSFLFHHVPGYGLFREPQKWVALLTLSYAVFAAAGIEACRTAIARFRRPLRHITVLALALPLIATHVMLWGFDRQLNNSKYPGAWARAESKIEGSSGTLLFLPWHLYEPLPFAQNRIVANPAPDYFTSPTLISTDPELGTSRTTAPTDPRTVYVNKLLNRRGTLRFFGHLVAPLGVHYVLLANVADASSYGFLKRQRDLRPVLDDASISLYLNTAYKGSVYAVRPTIGTRSVRRLATAPKAQLQATSTLNAVSKSGHGISGPMQTEVLKRWPRLSWPRGTYVSTNLSCDDGWKLGTSAPVCNLGAVAAFRKPRGGIAVLWRPGFGTQALGYVASSLAVIGLLWATRRTGRTRRSAQKQQET
jgi:hypothetical protein